MNSSAAALLECLQPWTAVPGDGWQRLRAMLEAQSDTAFGRAFGFSSIRSPSDFREAIPPMDYEAHRSWIERAADGESAVLACNRLLGFERTSGTTSRTKWIPVTDGLREEFARGLASCFGGWRIRCPEVFEGRAYWALSPPGLEVETTRSGLPIGMTSDAAYFPEGIGERLAAWLVVPDLGGNAEMFFEETAEALLATPDLSLVSVWSPTFLLGIDSALRKLRGDFLWCDLWPRLALVSCWADASSAVWVERLHGRLGGVPIEGKGLLATEGITSLPDEVDGTPRLASECHWHEFLDMEGNFTTTPELVLDGVYEVLLTTGGGLFRYRSGDHVRVTGFGGDGLPRLRFVGRDGGVSDLVGEKLHESQVLDALMGRGFLVADPDRPGYDLWLEEPSRASAVESRLRGNPYLNQALALRQLGPFRVCRLNDGWNARLTQAIARKQGCRMGDVKPPGLLTRIKPEEVASWLG